MLKIPFNLTNESNVSQNIKICNGLDCACLAVKNIAYTVNTNQVLHLVLCSQCAKKFDGEMK